MKRIQECTDDELVVIAQNILVKYNKALSDAKAIALEYGFDISVPESEIMDIVYAKLKENRDSVSKESV